MLTVLKDGQPIRARDERKPDHFWADKEIVEDYLPQLGIHAFATYMLLCFYARSTTGRAWPSIRTICKKLKSGRERVRKSLRELESAGLVIVSERSHISPKGNEVQDSYIYTLTAVKKHRDDESGGGSIQTQGGSNADPRVGLSVIPNKTNKNKTESTRQESNTLSKVADAPSTVAPIPFVAINHKTEQVIVPAQSYAMLSVDMSMLSSDWDTIAEKDAGRDYGDYARLSLNEALEAPTPSSGPPPSPSNVATSPMQSPPSEPALSAPNGTRWINPLEGDTRHLVRDANLPTTTLCGITPLPSYASGGEVHSKQSNCQKCLKATQKKPKAERKPQATDPLFEAIALHILSAKSKADRDAVAWRIGQIMHGDKKTGRCDGLITYEQARQGKDDLDYVSLASDVGKFWAWYKQKPDNKDLKDCAKVMEWWVKWRGVDNQKGVISNAIVSRGLENLRGITHPDFDDDEPVSGAGAASA